jgi:hypothetical protein
MSVRLDSILGSWIYGEPVASLWMFVTTMLVLGATFVSLRSEAGQFSRLVKAILKALAFVGIIWLFYFLMNSSNIAAISTFSAMKSGGTLVEQQRKVFRSNWGIYLRQPELNVRHIVVRQVVQQTSDKEPLYRNVNEAEVVPQESIVGFRGTVEIQRFDPRFNNFELTARYEYDIVNQSDEETTAEFYFNLVSTNPYENLLVTVDGRDIHSLLNVESGKITWKMNMSPHQQNMIAIGYRVRGMGSFYYDVPNAYKIGSFSLIITVDTDSFNARSSPAAGAIKQTERKREGGGAILEWEVKNAIMAPSIGIVFYDMYEQNNKLYSEASSLLKYVPRALSLFLIMLVMTWLICGVAVDLRRAFLMSAIFCVPFLGMMAFPLAYRIVYPLLVLAILGIGFLILQGLPRLTITLALILMAFYVVAYPLGGSIPDEPMRNAFEGIVQSGMILYIFGLSLYTRVRRRKGSPAG